MSDSVLMAQTPPPVLPATGASAAPVVLEYPPAQLAALPAGTMVTALIMPATTPADPPVISFSLPDGDTVVVETHLPQPVLRPTTLTFKIDATENGTVVLKPAGNFKQPDVSTKQTQNAPQPMTETTEPVRITQTGAVVLKEPLISSAFVLKRTPPAVLEQIPDFALEDPLPTGARAVLRITTVLPSANAPDAAPTETFPVPEGIVFSKEPASAATVADAYDLSAGNKVAPPLHKTPEPQMTVTGTAEKAPAQKPTTVQPVETEQNVPQHPAPTPENVPPPENDAIIKPSATAAVTEEPVKKQNDPPAPTTVKQPPSSETEKAPSFSKSAFLQETPAEKTVNGILFRETENEPAVIVTKSGVFALDTKLRLPDLSAVTLKIDSLSIAQTGQEEQNARPTVWQIMSNALETLKETDEGAYTALKTVLPQIGDKLPALMLSYMQTAVNGGDVASWLGDATVQALKASGPRGEAILKNLEKEFSNGPKKASDGKNGWRGYDIPMFSGNAIEPVSLYLQQTPYTEGGNGKTRRTTGNTVRFVLDLTLTRLGRLQLEGLATRSTRTFNLNIRHSAPLPDEFEQTVRSLFAKTLDAVDYAGTLAVKETDDFLEIRQMAGEDAFPKGFFA